MNFLDALKTGLPMQRPNSSFRTRDYGRGFAGGTSLLPGWMDPGYMLQDVVLYKEDFLAEDWEVKYPEVTITYDQFIRAHIETRLNGTFQSYYEDVAAALGLKRSK